MKISNKSDRSSWKLDTCTLSQNVNEGVPVLRMQRNIVDCDNRYIGNNTKIVLPKDSDIYCRLGDHIVGDSIENYRYFSEGGIPEYVNTQIWNGKTVEYVKATNFREIDDFLVWDIETDSECIKNDISTCQITFSLSGRGFVTIDNTIDKPVEYDKLEICTFYILDRRKNEHPSNPSAFVGIESSYKNIDMETKTDTDNVLEFKTLKEQHENVVKENAALKAQLLKTQVTQEWAEKSQKYNVPHLEMLSSVYVELTPVARQELQTFVHTLDNAMSELRKVKEVEFVEQSRDTKMHNHTVVEVVKAAIDAQPNEIITKVYSLEDSHIREFTPVGGKK